MNRPEFFVTEDDMLTDYRGDEEHIVVPGDITCIDDGAFYKCETITDVEIPEGVIQIGNSAFSMCSKLEKVTLPDSVTIIESSAFYGCEKMKSIRIPSGVNMIEWRVFTKCVNLESIDVDENNEEYCSVDGVMFTKNKAMLRYYPAGRADEEYTVPGETINISIFAFSDCKNLRRLTIPESVEIIDPGAFDEDSEIVLCVRKGSVAWKYALEYNLKFELV